MTPAQRARYAAALKSLNISRRTVNDLIDGYPAPEVANDYRMIAEIQDLTQRLDALTAVWAFPA